MKGRIVSFEERFVVHERQRGEVEVGVHGGDPREPRREGGSLVLACGGFESDLEAVFGACEARDVRGGDDGDGFPVVQGDADAASLGGSTP